MRSLWIGGLCGGGSCRRRAQLLSVFAGIPTDEEQATGLEKIIMKAMKDGTVTPPPRPPFGLRPSELDSLVAFCQ